MVMMVLMEVLELTIGMVMVMVIVMVSVCEYSVRLDQAILLRNTVRNYK